MKNISTLLCVAALAASGCAVTGATLGVGGKCETNSDCNEGLQCTANACTAIVGSSGGATDGGSDGGTDGTATSGASAGTSSGSTSGVLPTGASLRVVNASPSNATLDVCVKASTDTGFATAGVVGASGVAYGAASDFIQVTNDTSVTIRAIAQGGDCSTALTGVADLSAQDLSAATSHFTVVVSDTKIVLATSVPPASADVTNVSVVNVLTGVVSNTEFFDLLPYASFGGLATDTATNADISSFTGQALQVGLLSALNVTPDSAGIASGSRATVVAMGPYASAGKVLVCDDETTEHCKLTSLAAITVELVRLANLVDSADTLGSVQLCLGTSAVLTGAPSIPATASNVVSGDVVVTAAGGLTAEYFAVVPSGTTDCSAAVPTVTGSFSGGLGNITVALTGQTGGGATAYAATGIVMAPSTLISAAQRDVEVVNGAIDGAMTFGSANVNLKLTATTVATAVGYDLSSDISMPTTDFTAATGQAARAVSSVSELDFTVPTLVTSSTSLSFLLAGDAARNPKVLLCANDGSVDANGHSLCATADATNVAAGGDSISVRVANMSVDAGNVDLCAGSTRIVSDIAPGSVSAFVPHAYVSTNYGYVAHASVDTCAGALGAVTFGGGVPSAGDYWTVLLIGTSAVAVHSQDPMAQTPDGNSGFLNVSNAWGAGLLLTIGGTEISTSGSPGTGLALGHYSGYVAIDPTATSASITDTAAATASFNLPAGSLQLSGFYEAFVYSNDVGGDPSLVWCDDLQLDPTNSNLSDCVTIAPTP